MTTQLQQCLINWQCQIEYAVHTTGNSQELMEFEAEGVRIRLHVQGSRYFIEERIGKTMYPKLWKLTTRPGILDNKVVMTTDDEFEQWKQSKK